MTFPEEVILNLDRPGVCLALRLVLGDQTTIFCLQTNDSIHRPAVSDENCALATEKSSRFQGRARRGGRIRRAVIYQGDTEVTEFRIFKCENSGTPCSLCLGGKSSLRVHLDYWGGAGGSFLLSSFRFGASWRTAGFGASWRC